MIRKLRKTKGFRSISDATVVKWMANKVAHIASNFIGIGHLMEGIGLLTQSLNYYRTSIKSKEWPLRIKLGTSNLAVVQTFREYKVDNDLLEIPNNLGIRYKPPQSKRGRPSSSSHLPKIVRRRPRKVRPATKIGRDVVIHVATQANSLGRPCKILNCKHLECNI